MQIDITKLKSGLVSKIIIAEMKTFTKKELEGTELLELQDVHVDGTLYKNSIDGYEMDVTISGTMVLPCAITLVPVSVPFTTTVQGNIEEMLLEIGKIDKKMENTIDIFPIIWENILVEIPSRVISEDAKNVSLKGNGWKLCTEEQKEEINPELQKLKDLLK